MVVPPGGRCHGDTETCCQVSVDSISWDGLHLSGGVLDGETKSPTPRGPLTRPTQECFVVVESPGAGLGGPRQCSETKRPRSVMAGLWKKSWGSAGGREELPSAGLSAAPGAFQEESANILHRN